MESRWKSASGNQLKINRILWIIELQVLQKRWNYLKFKGDYKLGRNLLNVYKIYEIRTYRQKRAIEFNKFRKIQSFLWWFYVTCYSSQKRDVGLVHIRDWGL